ncbi:hypothetical protein CRENBAI_004842 [Crenichthys baileyi]|uniref:Uncharacterized protein n=1 Tax=Crenichthys baileyi TaxID=28760 RepID=A0AAV9S879_9TELE
MYGKEVEILPSPLLLQEMEEVFVGSRLAQAPPGYEPGKNRTTATPPAPMSSSSRPTSATVEFPAGFSSRLGRRHHQSFAPLLDPTSPSSDSRRETGAWSGAPEQPGTNAPAIRPPGKPSTPAWVLSGLAAAQAAYFDSCCLDAALYLAKKPQDSVYVLQAHQEEFPSVEFLDAPASVFAGGPPSPNSNSRLLGRSTWLLSSFSGPTCSFPGLQQSPYF